MPAAGSDPARAVGHRPTSAGLASHGQEARHDEREPRLRNIRPVVWFATRVPLVAPPGETLSRNTGGECSPR